MFSVIECAKKGQTRKKKQQPYRSGMEAKQIYPKTKEETIRRLYVIFEWHRQQNSEMNVFGVRRHIQKGTPHHRKNN